MDICKRNGKNKLLWLSDRDKTLAYEPKSGEMVLTVHRWFANHYPQLKGNSKRHKKTNKSLYKIPLDKMKKPKEFK